MQPAEVSRMESGKPNSQAVELVANPMYAELGGAGETRVRELE